MKFTFSLIAILLFIVTASAQRRTISKDEYEKVLQFAVEETNAAFPIIFKVTTDFIENGRTIRRVTDLHENESRSHHRTQRTTVAEGRETNTYQVSVGYADIFCSDDGVSWKPSKNECFGPVSVYGPRDAESIEYSVTAKSVKGKRLKVYREYSVFAPWDWSKSKKKDFQETVLTIDSRGFFRTVIGTEGTLGPRTVTLIRKQSWVTKAKIKPVVPPINRLESAIGTSRSSIATQEFHEYLRALIRSGFGKRLMFGSDQMIWPEAVGLAVEGDASFRERGRERRNLKRGRVTDAGVS
jgi:hypothetical protein